jgi:phosphodiesterase/alkaline phosphatase D-like protein
LDAESREVRAQDQEVRVEWEAGVPTLTLSKRWSRGQTWSFSAGTAYGFTETLAPGQIYRYRFASEEIKEPIQQARFASEEIKEPIQQAVTSCGWIYKGVVFGKP